MDYDYNDDENHDGETLQVTSESQAVSRRSAKLTMMNDNDKECGWEVELYNEKLKHSELFSFLLFYCLKAQVTAGSDGFENITCLGLWRLWKITTSTESNMC